MLIVRIKQAECALADGRLDEAFEIAKAEDVRRHRRGQNLTGKLARALAKRGQDNLIAHRLQQALMDCNKADKLGGNLPQIAELRQAVCDAMENKRHIHQQQSFKLAQAKRHIENGWFSVGERILADNSGNQEADGLLQQAAAMRLQVDAAVDKAEQALKHNDLESAIEIIQKDNSASSRNNKVADIIGQIRTLANRRIKQHLNEGRFDLANHLLQRLKPLAAESVEVKELSTVLARCKQAAELIETGQSQIAAQILKKLRVMLPSARWLETAITKAQQATEAIEALHTGPLGLFCSKAIESDGITEENGLSSEHRSTNDVFDLKLPSKFTLQVDGVGSFLVLSDEFITVGPISSSARPVLGLLADPNVPAATIERADEDYFIRSKKSIYINDKPVTEKLLVDGDRIALSARCRMKFHVPNAASTTAILALDGARLAHLDIRSIILMDRDILIGPGFNNHVRADQTDDMATLFMQDGYLYCKTNEKIIVNGQGLDSRARLPLNTQIRMGQISLVLAKLDW